MHKVYTQLGRLGVLKSRPDMRDDEVTVDTFIEQRTIFGSPKTVLAELIALRREAGPFGTLLLSRGRLGGPQRGVGARIAEPPRAGGDAGLSRADRRRMKRGVATIGRRCRWAEFHLIFLSSVVRFAGIGHDLSQFAGRIAGRVARAVVAGRGGSGDGFLSRQDA